MAPPSAGLTVEEGVGSAIEADAETEPAGAGLGLSGDVVHPASTRRAMTEARWVAGCRRVITHDAIGRRVERLTDHEWPAKV